MTSPAVDIIETVGDPELFADWFRDPSTWRAWFCFLRALFGLPMGTPTGGCFVSAPGATIARLMDLTKIGWW